VADLSPILVQVKLEADKLKADLDSTSSKLKNFGNTAKEQGGHVSELGQHINKLVKGYLGFEGAMKAIDFLKESGKAQVEDAKSAGLLEQQLKNTTGATKEQTDAVEESIRAMSNQYGVLDDKIRPAYAAIVRVTKDTGEATKLTDLAMNVAAGTGKNLTAVSMALAKAHEGQLGALTRLLPSVKGMKDPFAELQKQFAGAGEKAAQLDPYQRLTVAMDHIKESVGTAVVPIVEKLADVLTKAAPYVEKFMTALGNLGKGNASGITALFTNINKAITDFISGGGLTKFVESFASSREKIIKAISEILPKLVTVLVAMIPGLLNSAIGLFMSLVNAVVQVLPKLINTFTTVVLPKLISTLVELIPILIPASIKLFLALVTGLAKALPQIIKAVIDLIPVIVKTLIDAIPQLIDAGFQLIKGLVKGLVDNGPRLIGAAIKGLGDLVVNGFAALLGIKSPSTVFIGFGSNIVGGLAEGIIKSTPTAVEAVQLMSAKVVGAAKDMAMQMETVMSQALAAAGAMGAAVNTTAFRTGALTDSLMQTGLSATAAAALATQQMGQSISLNGTALDPILSTKILQAQAAASSAAGGYALYVNPLTGQTSAVQGNMTAADLKALGLGPGSGFVQATTQSGGLTNNVTVNASTNASPAAIAQAVTSAISNPVTQVPLGGGMYVTV